MQQVRVQVERSRFRNAAVMARLAPRQRRDEIAGGVAIARQAIGQGFRWRTTRRHFRDQRNGIRLCLSREYRIIDE